MLLDLVGLGLVSFTWLGWIRLKMVEIHLDGFGLVGLGLVGICWV